MKKLGIIGSENSHTIQIAKELNIEKSVPGFRVTHVWGETRALAKKAAEVGQIPNIVREPKDMIGQVDCVMVDHRHGKYHLPAVTPFVNAGIPVFVDKPMSDSLAAAKRFLQLRKKKRVPVTTMSSIPLQDSVKPIKKQLKQIGTLCSIHLNGPGDYRSKHGGVFFYGIHLVDLMVELLGTEAKDVTATLNGKTVTAVINYPKGVTATIRMLGDMYTFSVSAVGTGGFFQQEVGRDKHPYRNSTRKFTGMFKTGKEPFSEARMLAPIAVLEAIEKSLKLKRRVRVPRLG